MLTNTATQKNPHQEIDSYIKQCGGSYSQWYVGIASKPRERLFTEHNVDEKNGQWIYRDCGSSEAARQVEQYFLNLGCKGGTGGGDYTTRSVYAYRITQNTRQ
jgi:hypothetical protein